jgi:hypothetical protein
MVGVGADERTVVFGGVDEEREILRPLAEDIDGALHVPALPEESLDQTPVDVLVGK